MSRFVRSIVDRIKSLCAVLSAYNIAEKKLDKWILEAEERTGEKNPEIDLYRSEYLEMISAVLLTQKAADNFQEKWTTQCLEKTLSINGKPDKYVEPILNLTRIIRRMQLTEVPMNLYSKSIDRIEKHCHDHGIERLHRGGIYASYAIAYFEQGNMPLGMAYLYSAALEDIPTYQVRDIHETYALGPTGIFGDWLNEVLQKLPSGCLPSINNVLTGTYAVSDVQEFCLWSARQADLRLVQAIIDYDGAKGRVDDHSASVRLTCLRELAGFFEVLWKRFGSMHRDPQVSAIFAEPPMLARLICHMHFIDSISNRRSNPTLRANKAHGLLWNNIEQCPEVLDAIDDHIDYCKPSYSLSNVWLRLSTTTLSPTTVTADYVAKRFLLTYRIRNDTAHKFEPMDPTFLAHSDEFFAWLLEANIYLYLWVKETRQVTF